MKISIYAPLLKSVLKQRVNIQFCILNESSARREVILGPDLFGGRVINALLCGVG
jgi:hypothetical protein